MPITLLALLVLALVIAVLIAIGLVMWHARTSARESRVAVATIAALSAWAIVATMLASRGLFEQPESDAPPPIGVALMLVLAISAASLLASKSLRRLLTNQSQLILLNLWRLVGIVFLLLMITGQVPALWALPAGIGDVIVGATAPWVASRAGTPRGRPLAIVFNLFGMADLVVAVGLGVMTSPGPPQVFHTTPTSELLTQFPLALVPTFLVPLAFALHVVSLWQLLAGTWAPRPAGSHEARR